MKVLVTGVAGQLGHDVINELAACGHEAIGSDLPAAYSGMADGTAVTILPYLQLDITDAPAVDRLFQSILPDAVIHCAGWTSVDEAECDEIARACQQMGCRMMYISTDYVFDGHGTLPWKPDCKDYAPLNVYGRSKLRGEQAVSALLSRYFIVRIAWAFGANGKNFVKTMLDVGRKQDTVRVVNDQIGTPTYTLDLARLLVDMIQTEKYGYYHATNEGGYISWSDFAKEIYRQAGMDVTVVPVSSQEYGPSRARRPFNSRLDKSKLTEEGFRPLPTWQDALRRYLSA